MLPNVHLSNNDINRCAPRAIAVSVFNIGGLMDIVDHKKTDYLAKLFDLKPLEIGINWSIEDEGRNRKLLSEGTIRAKVMWELSVILKKYIRAYQSVLNFD